jgi:hypothetical protein
MENTATKEDYAPPTHPQFACRRYSRQIWREHPELTVDEMLERYEIKFEACKGQPYERTELLAWILPDSTLVTSHRTIRHLKSMSCLKLPIMFAGPSPA